MTKHKKINLEFISEEFSFDEEKKTTKCTLKFNPHFKDFAELYGRPNDDILMESPKKYACLIDVFNNDTFVTSGVSVCAKDDEFDKETGMKLAQLRARNRAEKKYERWLSIYMQLVVDSYNRLGKARYFSKKAQAENQYIEKSFFQ